MTSQGNATVRLDKALHAWGSVHFEHIMRRQIELMDATDLPLQEGLSTGNLAIPNLLGVIIINCLEDGYHLWVKAGLFYKSVISGCSCADDPTPVPENDEYCVVSFAIDKASAVTTISLLDA